MKTTNKLLKAIVIITLLLGSNQLIAQTNTSPTQTVCAGSLSEPYLINPPTAGSTYQWALSGGGTLNNGATTDNITVDWGITPGTYTITVTEMDINGCLGAPVSVDVTVIPLPTATTAISQTACLGSVIPNLTAIGASVNWYSDAALTTNVFTGNSFATGQTTVGTHTYYVTESLNGCEGPSVPVTLEIYALPVVTAIADQTICDGYAPSSLNASSVSAGTYSWVDAADPLGIVLGTGSNFPPPPLTTSTTYTVTFTETSSGCTASDDVTITVTPLDDATFTLTDYCEGSSNSATVTGTAGGVFTFTAPAPTGGEAINSVTGEITGGIAGTTYSVTYTTIGICPQSSAQTVTVTPLDDATFTLTDYCEGSSNSATVTGTAGGVFTFTAPVPTGGETINSSTGEITGGISGTTYSVTYTTTGICPQSSIQNVTIYATPSTGPISHW
ncbi:MAG: hypothetical protein HN535_03770 [Flavobacteriales bacterium]|nr:hypothetical protein [Flavobacteriales bacterium]